MEYANTTLLFDTNHKSIVYIDYLYNYNEKIIQYLESEKINYENRL